MQARAKRNHAQRIVEAIELTERLRRRVERRLNDFHKDGKRRPRLAARWIADARIYARRAERLRNFVKRETTRWASVGNLIAQVQGIG